MDEAAEDVQDDTVKPNAERKQQTIDAVAAEEQNAEVSPQLSEVAPISAGSVEAAGFDEANAAEDLPPNNDDDDPTTAAAAAADDGDDLVDSDSLEAAEDDDYDFDVDDDPLTTAPPNGSTHSRDPHRSAARDESDSDDDPAAKEARVPARRLLLSTTPSSFASSVQAILSQPTPIPSSPILAAHPHPLPAPSDPSLTSQRRLTQKRRIKRALLDRHHRPADASEVERRYRAIATKGVVQLFNALQRLRRDERERAQREREDRRKAAEANAVTSGQGELSRDGLVQLIRTADASVGGARAVKDEKAGAGWSVLRDDFMLGGKLTDWDKNLDSDDEDEDERETEMELT